MAENLGCKFHGLGFGWCWRSRFWALVRVYRVLGCRNDARNFHFFAESRAVTPLALDQKIVNLYQKARSSGFHVLATDSSGTCHRKATHDLFSINVVSIHFLVFHNAWGPVGLRL